MRYAAPPAPQVLSDRLGIPLDQVCKLDGNESPYGPPPAVLDALTRAAASAASLTGAGRYPDASAAELRSALARYTGIPAEGIVIGNGSDELIGLLAELLLAPGDEVVVSEPTFSVYRIVAERRGARVVDAGRDTAFQVSPQALAAAITPRTRLIFLCAPNNPTGTPLPRTALESTLERAEALAAHVANGTNGVAGPLVVVDEAYYEIGALAGAPDAWTAAPLVRADGRLVILRTFSKLFGLAGLRVGYALCPPELAVRLRERKMPYNVNTLGLVAAQAALGDLTWLRERAAAIVAERERLALALRAFPGARVHASAANFLLLEWSAAQAEHIWLALLERGILVRYFAEQRLANCLRITIGTPEQNDRLLAALRDIVSDAVEQQTSYGSEAKGGTRA
jgi:histidinol-phosphate aminotransferase